MASTADLSTIRSADILRIVGFIFSNLGLPAMIKTKIIFLLLPLTAMLFLPDQIDAKVVKAPSISNSIENLKTKGDFYFQHKQYEDAVRIYKEILERKSDFYAVHYSLGVALEALERYAEAIEQLDRIPKESHLYFDALSIKGLALNGSGQNEAALDIFEFLTTSVPEDGSYWCNKSKVLINMGLFEKAIEVAQTGLQVDNDNVFLLNNLGIAQFRSGHYEKALQTSKKAFELAPGNFDAVDNLASALAQLGRYQEALKYYDRAAELDSTSFSTLYERGYALEMCEKIDQAAECYQKAVKIEPTNPGVWCRLVYILDKNGDFQDAFDTVEKALAFHAKEFYLWYTRGIVAEELNKSEEALQSYKTAIEINPEDIDAWLRLIDLLARNGDFQDAFDTIEKALTFHAKELDMWYARGKLATKLNKREEALRSYKMVTEINSEDEEAKINIAIEYALKGEFETALNSLKEANIALIDVIKTIEAKDEYQTLLSDSVYGKKLQTFIDTLRIE